jgi:glycosyltransferase involved in cell wall biosynthesis
MWSDNDDQPLKFRLPRFTCVALWYMLRVKPHILHCFSVNSALPAIIYKKLHRQTTLVYELHGVIEHEMATASPQARLLYRILDRLAVRQADAIITTSSKHRDYVIHRYGVRPEKATVMWGYIDIAAFPYREPAQREQFVVGYSGNDAFWQGISILLEAAAVLKSERDITFQFVGPAPEKYSGLGLTNVRFLGRVPWGRIPDVLADCDALLSTRIGHAVTDSPYPHKLSTYLAVGRPVIVSDVGDQGMVVRKAQCGVVVSPLNAQTVADGILSLKHMTHDQRLCLGEKARIFAEKNLSLQAMGDLIEEIYQCCEEGRPLPITHFSAL